MYIMGTFIFLASLIFYILILDSQVESMKNRRFCNKQFKVCVKSHNPNRYMSSYFRNHPDFCFISVRQDLLSKQNLNEEFHDYKCNLIDDIFRFKGNELRSQNIFIGNQMKPISESTIQFITESLRELDSKNLFKIKSKDFTLENFKNLYDTQNFLRHVINQERNPQYLKIADNLLSLKKISRNKLFNLKTFVYMPSSSDPYIAYLKFGYLDFYTVYSYNKAYQEMHEHPLAKKFGLFNQYSIQQFLVYLKEEENLSEEDIDQIFKKTKQYITYTIHSLFQDLQEKAKFFSTFELDIAFNEKNWSPIILNIQNTNIFEDQSYQGRFTPRDPKQRYKSIRQFTQEVFEFQGILIKNFKNQDHMKTLFKSQDILSQISKNMIPIINEANKFSFINSELNLQQNQSPQQLMHKIYQRKKIMCYVDRSEKTIPFLDYLERTQTHKWFLVHSQMYKANLHKCDFIYSTDYYVGSLGIFNVDFENTLWNFTPQVANMHNKAFFFQLLQQFDKFQKYSFNSTQFYPETYVLNYTNVKYTQSERDFLAIDSDTDKDLWIVKPTTSSRGKGIQIFNNIADAKSIYRENKKHTILTFNPLDQLYKNNDHVSQVMQRYIKNTQLLEKKKYDIRCYIFFAWSEPGAELVYYHRGYGRRSTADYVENEDNITAEDLLKHLTNASVQQKNDATAKFGNNTIVSIEEIKAYWKREKGLTDKKIDSIFDEIKKALTYVGHSYLNILTKRTGYFQFFGCDIMFDHDFRPYVIEANSSPQVLLDTPHLKQIIPEFAKSVLDLELFLHDNRKNAKQIIKEYKSLPVTNLDLLINKANGYDYLEEYKIKNNNNNNNQQQQNSNSNSQDNSNNNDNNSKDKRKTEL